MTPIKDHHKSNYLLLVFATRVELSEVQRSWGHGPVEKGGDPVRKDLM